MPILSDLEVTSASYADETGVLTVSGIAFSENQYSGKAQASIDGVTWTDADAYTSWADSQIVCTFDPVLDSGTYKLRVINGDNETSAALDDAFVVASAGPVLTSATYLAGVLTVAGSAFLTEQGSGKVEVKLHSGSTWIDATAYDAWADTEIECTFTPSLAYGTYDARVYQSETYSDTLASEFEVVAPVPVVTDAAYVDETGRLTITGTGLEDARGTGKVQVSVADADTWVDAYAYPLWSATSIVCRFSPILAIATYDVRVVQNAQTSDVFPDAFAVTAEPSGVTFTQRQRLHTGLLISI